MKALFLPILLAFFVLLNPVVLKAQLTLTAANSGYLIGEEFILATHNAGFYYFIQPQIGPNQVWNFNGYPKLGSDTIKILSRTQAPFSTSLPSANLVIYSSDYKFNNGSNYRYLETDSLKVIEKGKLNLVTNQLTPYLESPEIFRFPFGINSNFIDTSTTTYFGANNATCIYKEIITVEAVGYGQIITPSATYNQALQVRTTREVLSDNCQPQMYQGFYTDIYYTWHVPGIHAPVFQIAEHTASLGYFYSSFYLQAVKLGIEEETKANVNLQTFPNPATSEVTIQFALKSASVVHLRLTDALGREVMRLPEEKQPAGNKTQTLDISKLPKGVYLVRLETEEGTAIKRLLIH